MHVCAVSPVLSNSSQLLFMGFSRWYGGKESTANAGDVDEIPPHTSQKVSIKKSAYKKCRKGCGEKRTLLHYWWKCKLVQPLWRTIWKFLEKLKLELSYDRAIPILGICPEKNKKQKTNIKHGLKGYMHSNVYNSQDMEAT
uniref:Uncharacterized protein n=1 Tax=Ovis aries TaxID=9940 RepID=A0AC11E7U0_SHEEP